MALVDFITTFNSGNRNVYKIDPLNTFSLKIDFSPTDSKIIEQIKNCKFSEVSEFSANLGKFVQQINLPNFSVTSGSSIETVVHSAMTHKELLNPDSQTFSMDVINTKVPILEEIFYPWMREIQYPAWHYKTQPYTTADLTIDLTSHSDVSYHLLNCRPIQFDTFNPSQDLASITRTITFAFDLMYVTFMGNYTQDGLKNLATKLINKSLKTVGL